MKAILLSILLLQGCSAIGTIGKLITPSSGLAVDTEIVAGDKKQELAVVGKKETTTNTAETITQTYNTIQQGKSIWDIFLMMLMSFLVGWLAMPSTRQMWLTIKNMRKNDGYNCSNKSTSWSTRLTNRCRF